jgi:hypothetical protein
VASLFVQSVAIAIAVLLCGCASSSAVQRVSSEPIGCEFLATVYVDQLGHQPAGSSAVKYLVDQAKKWGGDTLLCCEMGTEETVALWTNRRTGESYAGSFRHSGRVYRCVGRADSPAPNKSLERTPER